MTRRFPLSRVGFDERGLVPVIAQEETTGEVLMLAWANRQALERSLSTGRMHYYSRSRGELWEKGATSGNRQRLVSLSLDCDGDAVLALVTQEGPACHRGTATCFARPTGPVPQPVLGGLAATIESRRRGKGAASYTRKLLRNAPLARAKILEEAVELAGALKFESQERVREEAADLLYHMLAASAGRGVTAAQVLKVLARRRR